MPRERGCEEPELKLKGCVKTSFEEEWVLARHPGPEGRMIQAEKNVCQDAEPTVSSQSLLSSVPSCKKKDI